MACTKPGIDNGSAAYLAGDHETAFQEIMPLARAGDATAQYNIGVMYARGDGVPEDHAEAVRWYRRAADQGQADAQLNLGVMYVAGEGVPRDLTQALMWLDLAAATLPSGVKRDRAVEYRGQAETMLSPAQIARARAMAQDWRPKAEAGAEGNHSLNDPRGQ